ncbi:10749_t:CDS:1, partial [Cetraspora pellucida]
GIYLSERDRDYAEEHLWDYDSFWTSETAILAGNEKVRFEDIEEVEYGITTNVVYYDKTYQITNIYAPIDTNKLDFLDKWIPYRIENTVNVIVGVFDINLGSIIRERLSGFTDAVDILGEFFIPDIPKDCIFIDNDYTHFCQSVEKIESHKHRKPLLVCTIDPFIWKLDKRLLEDTNIQVKITDEIVSVNTILEWDLLKKHIQSVFRERKLLNFDLKSSNFSSNSSDIKSDLANLDRKVREDLINAGWAETNVRATQIIRDPSAPNSKDPKDILNYITNYYQ